MPHGARGGAYPGERRAGRKKGTPNRATVERAIIAQKQVVQANAEGRELAKDKLEKYMLLCEGAAAVFRPTSPEEIAAGKAPRPGEDWVQFGEWIDRAVYCAKELTKYQSPTFKAIMTAPPPPTDEPEKRKAFSLTIFEGGKPARLVKVAS